MKLTNNGNGQGKQNSQQCNSNGNGSPSSGNGGNTQAGEGAAQGDPNNFGFGNFTGNFTDFGNYNMFDYQNGSESSYQNGSNFNNNGGGGSSVSSSYAPSETGGVGGHSQGNSQNSNPFYGMSQYFTPEMLGSMGYSPLNNGSYYDWYALSMIQAFASKLQ